MAKDEIEEEDLATDDEETVAGKKRRTLKESIEQGLPIWLKIRADELIQIDLDEEKLHNSSDFKQFLFNAAGIKVMSTARTGSSTGIRGLLKKFGIQTAEELQAILEKHGE